MAGPRGLSPEQVAKLTSALSRDRAWAVELKKANRKVGTVAVKRSRAEMRGQGDRRLAAAAKALRSAPSATSVAVRVGSRVQTSKGPANLGLATVWGMTPGARTGWNQWSYTRPSPGRRVAPRALGPQRTHQHPDHIGNNWLPATRGQGPRGLNDAMADSIDELGEIYLDGALAVVARAFPSGTLT